MERTAATTSPARINAPNTAAAMITPIDRGIPSCPIVASLSNYYTIIAKIIAIIRA